MIQQTKHCKKNLENIKNKFISVKIMQLTFAIIAIALAYFAMPAAAETNLIANWTFNEDAGTVASDSSGNGNNVNLINGPIWTTGKIGNALQFDGTNDYAVNTSATGIPGTSPFSVVALVNGKSFLNPKWSDIVRKEGSWAVQISPNSNLNLEITGKQDTISDIVVPTNVWTHIAVTFEGTTVKFYMNGVLGDTKIQTNVPNAGLNTIDIGGYTSWGTYLNGALDDVKIYNRTLNASEISADYQNSSMSANPASTPTSSLLLEATSKPASAPTSVQLLQATSKPTPALKSVTIPQATPKPTPAPTQAPAPTSTPIQRTSGKLLFDGGYEKQNVNTWVDAWPGIICDYENSRYNTANADQWEMMWACASNRFSKITSPVRDGTYAGKFTVEPGDRAPGGERAEMVMWKPYYWNGKDIGYGNDFYYAWSTYLPSPGWQNANTWQLFWQAHTANYKGSPEVSLMLGSDDILFLGKNNGVKDDVNLGITLSKNVWHDFIVHVKWTKDATGVVEVWHKLSTESNFEKLHTKTGYKTAQTLNSVWGSGEESIRTQFGIYRSAINGAPTSTIYNDAFRIGTTFDSVLY